MTENRGDFDEWEQEASDLPHTDRGFFADPPASPEEAKARAAQMSDELITKLARRQFEEGYTVIAPTVCVVCGRTCTLQDRDGIVRHRRCLPR